MNLNHLRFFCEVSRTGSFTEAAKACCVTQPTLSNGILQLEDTLGAKLFVRTTRKVSLTPFGRHMLPTILQMLDVQNGIQQAAEQFLKPTGEPLGIGFSPLADMGLIKASVDSYAVGRESAQTFFKECYIDALYARLEDDQIALAVCPRTGNNTQNIGFNSAAFYREPVFVIQKDDDEITQHLPEKSLIDDLEKQTFVVTSDLCGHAPTIRNWFRHRGKTLREYPGQAVSYEVMQEWGALGIASAILPWSKINDINRAKVSALFIEADTEAMIEFDWIWKANSRHDEHILGFLDHCKTHLHPIIRKSHLSGEKFLFALNSDAAIPT